MFVCVCVCARARARKTERERERVINRTENLTYFIVIWIIYQRKKLKSGLQFIIKYIPASRCACVYVHARVGLRARQPVRIA